MFERTNQIGHTRCDRVRLLCTEGASDRRDRTDVGLMSTTRTGSIQLPFYMLTRLRYSRCYFGFWSVMCKIAKFELLRAFQTTTPELNHVNDDLPPELM